MKKAILFILLFFLGVAFIKLNYANAVDACVYTPNETVGTRQCGQPSYCSGCNWVNDVTTCSTDSNSNPIPSTCQFIKTDIHEANSSECVSTCATPAPTCRQITCGGEPGAGGICKYGTAGSPPGGGDNVDIGTCQYDECPGGPVPGHTISVCLSTGCYENSCECWPNSPCPAATLTPIIAPAPVCPVPPTVTNIRVTCPYCGT